MYQPLRLEAVQQACQRGAFHRDALRQLALGGFVIETGRCRSTSQRA